MFESPLFAAALVGDVRAGGELIRSLGKDGLAGSSSGFPLLLHCAMMSGSWAMVSLLVDFAASLAGASAAAACGCMRQGGLAAAPQACRPFSRKDGLGLRRRASEHASMPSRRTSARVTSSDTTRRRHALVIFWRVACRGRRVARDPDGGVKPGGAGASRYLAAAPAHLRDPFPERGRERLGWSRDAACVRVSSCCLPIGMRGATARSRR